MKVELIGGQRSAEVFLAPTRKGQPGPPSHSSRIRHYNREINREKKEVVKKFYQILEARRRRRALVNIRREFEKARYPLNQFGDSQIEAALTRWTDDIASVTLNAKAMYRVLRQLRGVPALGTSSSAPETLQRK